MINWAKLRSATWPELRMLVAIPNGAERTVRSGVKLVREGMSAGFPDLFLFVARDKFHGLAIEMKRPETRLIFGKMTRYKGRLRPNQEEWHERLKDFGYAVEVCYGFDHARQTIEKYLGMGEV